MDIHICMRVRESPSDFVIQTLGISREIAPEILLYIGDVVSITRLLRGKIKKGVSLNLTMNFCFIVISLLYVDMFLTTIQVCFGFVWYQLL